MGWNGWCVTWPDSSPAAWGPSSRTAAAPSPLAARAQPGCCTRRAGAKYRPSLAGAGTSPERSLPFRAYLLWLTFPPINLLFLDQPFGLVVTYGVIGALFMPLLAVTLLWLLNSLRTPAGWRNGVLSSLMLGAAGLLFVVLCVQQLRQLPW